MNKSKRYKIKNPEKVKAQNRALWVHKKSQVCSIKGCNKIGVRHHSDYDKPDEIIWLCKKHHLKIHGKLRGKCSICDKPHHAKGLCRTHYRNKYPEQWYGKSFGKGHRPDQLPPSVL